MLEKLILHNFKSHKSTELNFDNSRLHGIVGKNSAGKTTVLQALHYLSMIPDTSVEKIFEYDRSPQFITTIGEKNMSVTASGYWDNQKNCQVSYSLENKNNNNNWIAKLSWNIDGNKSSLTHEKLYGSYSYSPQDPPLPSNFFKPTVYLKLVASNLAKPAYSEEITPKVEFDGSGLAPTLDFLRDEAPDQFQLIEEKLSRIVPNVRKVGIKRAKVPVIRKRLIEVDGKSISYEETQEMTGQEVVLDMNTGERIPAHAISEGTMLTLGLLTVLMNPNQPNLVLLDDVEQGLHPQAQRELMNVFKEIIAENPNLQIIFSTHSPYIIDALTPSQVHILNNSKSGFTMSKRLDEHPDVEWAKETLTTGESWDAEGEDWVTEGEVCD
ncbi:AAA family ATPase [Aphanizomenon flos-aquae]|uniref:AAA family ATPase n=1 Tax=Aphanizomenon flos-aquae TaxID=1176 RepID=UPI001681259C|nr:ATP-binding protein [Aphanizomenon flos-aquae]MBD2392629.1 AAA family ATPase [Aphanizomenon flos-aquae FACHB-1171]MBD2559009.1 AAA family ATPase [Aphanizomenon flos-aquae FACHB-1290]MBD2659310.1 AAA family ATPase [Aphanizomenon flos-aquae FACHB-1265]MBD2698989.1 AAA family ATPase [Aphanizomenon flos-aquae FACHB-1287]